MGTTVFFAASEADHFTGTHLGHTVTGVDTNYVRGGVITKKAQIATATMAPSTPDNDADGYWLHYRKYQGSTPFRSHQPLYLYHGSGNLSFHLNNVDNGGVKARLYASNGSYTESATSYDFYAEVAGIVNTTINIDIHVFTNASGQAEVHIFRDGHRKLTLVNAGGYHRGLAWVNIAHVSDSGAAYNSEVIVADYDTRKLRLSTHVPSADGYYTDGTGSYSDIDEIVPDAAAITLSNPGEMKSVAIAKFGSPGAGTIKAIGINSRLYTVDDTVDFQAGLRMDGLDYLSTKLAATGAFSPFSRMWNANPAGGDFPANPATDIEVVYKLVDR